MRKIYMSISLPIIVDHSCYTLHLPTPNVPDINEVVSPPSAPLPAWDGKLQWLEAWLANIPPPKPGEALIRKLAKEKALDPATGKPMSGLPAFSQDRLPL